MKKEKFTEKTLKISADLSPQARKSPFWKRVLQLLSSPSRAKCGVNVGRLTLYAKEGSFVVVPDKVLGSGQAAGKLTVAAVSFSTTAKRMIEAAGGKTMTIAEASKKSPTGKDVLIIK